MSRSYNPFRDDLLGELLDRVRVLESNAPTGNSSVSKGAFEIRSIDGLIVEGQARVTGILVVDGTLTVSGTETVTGSLIISGGQIINGTFIINGTTTVNGVSTYVGDVNITGLLNLTGTMHVLGGGQIKVGALTISPTVADGSGLNAPVKIKLDTPLVEVTQSLGVGQSLVVEGTAAFQATVTVELGLTAEGDIVAPNFPLSTRTDIPFPNVVVWNPGNKRLERTV